MWRAGSERELRVEFFGARLPGRILLGPVGVQEIIHAGADVASARAAASLGLPFVFSTVSSRSIEEVAQSAAKVAEPPRWYQFFWGKKPKLTAIHWRPAEPAVYSRLGSTLPTHS